MGDYTYLVFLVVASVAAALITIFTAGVGAVLLYVPGQSPHRETHVATAAPAADRYAA